MAFGKSNAVSVAFEGKDNVSPVVRGIRNSMEGFKRDASQGFGIAAGFNVATAAMNLGVGALRGVVDYAGQAIDKASALGEAQSKVAAVFGDSADIVHEWSKTTTDAFGISELAAESAAGTFGNLFTSFGIGAQESAKYSTSLVELAADMASFNNTGIEEAIQAITSGLAGEMEPMKRYGAILSVARIQQEALAQGIIESGEAMTQQQKIAATYSLIMKDTANAQGDFERTSEGLANQQRKLDARMEDLSTTLGRGLLPAAVGVVGALSDMASAIEWLVSDKSDASLDRLIAKFKGVTEAAQEAAEAQAGDWWGTGTVLDSALDGLNALQKAINESPIGPPFLRQWGEMQDALSGFGKLLGWNEQQLKMAARAAVEAGLSVQEAVALTGEDFWNNIVQWDERPDTSQATKAAKSWAVQVTEDIRIAVFDATGDFDVNEVLMSALGNATTTGKDWAGDLFGMVSGRISGDNAKTKRGKGSLYAAVKQQLKLEKNNVRDLLRDPKLLEDIQGLYNKHSRFLERKLGRSQEGGNTLASLYIGESIDANSVNLTGISAAAVAGATEFATKWNETFDANIKSYIADLFRGELESLSVSATVAVTITGDRGLLEWLVNNGVTPGSMPPYPGGADGKASTPYPRAMGGDVAPRTTYLVGENGPEIVRLGRRGGSVTPSHAMGGSLDGVAVYLDGRLVGRLIDERLGRAFGGKRGTY